MTNKQYFLAPGLLLAPFLLAAQLFPKTNYPQGYFRNPLNISISLAGNFGELRPGHYHMGMDIKTDARENLPVHAAADGYIARIKIEPAGFGRAIYIDHPNGLTTVYCHLNNFAPEIESWLKQQQYKLESWKVMLDVPHDRFPVKRGDFIAWSGNTGGSQGPHLHFEIRRTKDDVNLNPQLFGFSIPDNTRPNLLRLSVYDRHKSTYEQSPKIVPVKKTGAEFTTIPGVITISSDKISFAITAYDTHTGSSNLNGIYEGVLYVDDQLITGFRMDNVSYDNTRYMNAHIDYRTKTNGGPYLQHLSELPGYVNSIYAKGRGDGVVNISNGEVHDIRIEVKDAAGNTSVLQTRVQYRQPVTPNSAFSIQHSKLFYPLMLDVYESSDCEFYIGEKCLYDSVHIRYGAGIAGNPAVVSRVHTIGEVYIPLQDYFTIRIKPTAAANKNRVVMQRFAGSKKDVQKVEWQGEWAAARFRDFGSFQLVEDNMPPQIVPIGFKNGSNLSKASRIAFTVKDNLGKFKNVRAELDPPSDGRGGKWLRFTNDKGRTFIYLFDEICPPGEHTLVITAEDEAGNTTRGLYHFTR